MKIKKIILLLFIIILNTAGLFFGAAAFAQSDADNLLWGGFESNVQETTGLGNEDPREIVARVINILLGFLGIIAVLIIILGGFRWMLSGGDSERADESRRMIVSGILGILLILAAFAIAQFILNSLYNATNAIS
ncbi:MAG: pilin [Candidatus Falkowbacteria bacterium]